MLAVGAEALADLAASSRVGASTSARQRVAASAAALGREALQDRQGEGGGLAGAGLGDAEQVAPVEDAGDGLRLDRGGRVVAFAGQRLEQRRSEAEI